MPKSRYRDHGALHAEGRHARPRHDVPHRTVQANLDFSSEADMVAKLRVGLALQPMITALFANSPFTDGKLERPAVGALGNLARHRHGAHRHAALRLRARHGLRALRRLRARRADVFRQARRRSITTSRARASAICSPAGSPRCRASARRISDWANHLSTIFPEVRLKRYLEMRGADVGPRERIGALPALMVGLYYDPRCARRRLRSDQGLERGRRARPCATTRRASALAARIGGRDLAAIARETLGMARAGLARRARRDAAGRDETFFSTRSTPSPRRAGRLPSTGWRASREPGVGRSSPSSTKR